MRHLFYIACCLLLSLSGYSQLGAGTLYLASGVVFTADSLVMIPSTNITITGNALTHTYVPVPGYTSGNSISRVYHWTSPITYSGEIGIIYSDAELAGNTELSLQMAFHNAAWTTTSTSTVNTGTNYVSYSASGLTFDQATATNAGVALPIIYAAFGASVKTNYVQLDWQMADIENLHHFDVEFSNDGRNWQTASTITPSLNQTDFSYRHSDLNFSTRYYRIAGIDLDGERTYTKIVSVRNNFGGSNLRIVRQGSNSLLYFTGPAPVAVQIYDMKGQLMQTRNVVQQQCEVNGLIPGTYVIFYIVEGQKLTRKIQL